MENVKTKYWTITYPGAFGQHVEETFSEEQILKSYWDYWYSRMAEVGRLDIATEENCIMDWIVLHWAWETDKFGNDKGTDNGKSTS